jgi:phytoene dehydrogenase-like protein
MSEPVDGAPVAVVGAGVAGLACALQLQALGVPARVFEAEAEVGGRVRTDRVDGFLLDRGFQVLPTAYPEVQRLLDLDALALGRFLPGAILRRSGAFARFVDPSRHPLALFGTLASRALPLTDLLRMWRLRRRACSGSWDDVIARPEEPALARLRALGFSTAAIEGFLRPFFAGVFLEAELASTSRFLELALRTFALGDASLPARGMSAVPNQLAARLAEGVVALSAPVEAIEPGAIRVAGERLAASAVVVATDGAAAHRLAPGVPAPELRPATCLYFAADVDPVRAPLLVLDGERGGPVTHLCVPSAVAPSYAPPGRALISANVVGPIVSAGADLERAVRAQLTGWFGGEVGRWELLRIDQIPSALPALLPGRSPAGARSPLIRPGVFVCGDHWEFPSLQGALRSGRRAGSEVARMLGVDVERSEARFHS